MVPYKSFAFQKTWSSWNEQDLYSLASGDVFVCLFDSPNAGDDETGAGGGLSGSDLILTQGGNVAGATGTPPYREMDGSDDYFQTALSWFNTIFAGEPEYTLILKTYLRVANVRTVFNASGITNLRLKIENNSGKIRWGMNDYDHATEYQEGTNDLSAQDNQVCYLAMWTSAAAGVSRAGWCVGGGGSGANGQPTKWSDFNAGDRVEFSSVFDNISNASYNMHIFAESSGVSETEGRLYYIVAAKTCLIDNSA
jgi:hypothetical protein